MTAGLAMHPWTLTRPLIAHCGSSASIASDLRLDGVFLALDLGHLEVLTTPLSPAVSTLMPALIHCAFRRPSGRAGDAKLFTQEVVLNHAEHPEMLLFAHLRAGFDADSAVQNCEALDDESPRWRSQFGVVPRQHGRVL